MTATPSSPVLSLPAVDPTHYPRNLIRAAVCEVRFPTIYEFAADKPPAKLWNALRKEYPHPQAFQDVAVTPRALNSTPGHELLDKKRRWKVVLRAASLTLETSSYSSFDEFKSRLLSLWEAAQSTLDTDFYIRLGLRYTNTVPYDRESIRDWVRPELAALYAHPIGEVSEYMTKVLGPTDFGGGYILQAGLVKNNTNLKTEFCLDFDLYKEDVAVSEAPALIDVLHDWEFRLFDWSLGPAARRYLDATT
jgi:uncharacterized protein (TIGR04255 family)